MEAGRQGWTQEKPLGTGIRQGFNPTGHGDQAHQRHPPMPAQGQDLSRLGPWALGPQGPRAQAEPLGQGVHGHWQEPQARHPQHPIHPRWQGRHGQHQGLHPNQTQAPHPQRRQGQALGPQGLAIGSPPRQAKGPRRQGDGPQAQPGCQFGTHHRGRGAGIEQQAHGASIRGERQHGGVSALGPLKGHHGAAADPAAGQRLALHLDQGSQGLGRHRRHTPPLHDNQPKAN